MTQPFTLRDLIAAELVSDLILGEAKIKWTDDGGETLRRGTIRRLCDADGGSASDLDVRDAFIHVTTREGSEVLIAFSDAMAWASQGAIAKGW